MNKDSESKQEADSSPADDKPAVKISRTGVIALLLAMAAMALSTYYHQRVQQELAATTALSEGQAEVQQAYRELTANLATLNGSLRQLSSRQQEMDQAMVNAQQRLDNLSRQQGAGEDVRLLAEVEHLLVIASHKLALEGDVAQALVAVQEADKRLQSGAAPGLLDLRRQLASNMNSLQGVEAVDVAGLVLYLSDLGDRVFDLPLLQPRISSNAPEGDPDTLAEPSSWRQFLDAAWAEIKSLVQISRQGQHTPATLRPDESYFLYQNLRLQLESARLSVLRKDTQSFRAALTTVDDWLSKFFDGNVESVANIRESVTQMQQLELKPELPDLGPSLQAVRAYRLEISSPAAPGQTEGLVGE